MSFSVVHDSSCPCPVCGRDTGKCKQTDDGLLVCRQIGAFPGEEVNGFEFLKTSANPNFGVWKSLDPSRPSRPAPTRNRAAEKEARFQDFRYQATFGKRLTPKDAGHQKLAKHLGIDLREAWRVRVQECEVWGRKWWAFPTVDAEGKLVGASLRSTTGEKRSPGDGQGLIIPQFAAERAQSQRVIYVVRGASDVLAIQSAGGVAIGTLSDGAGTDNLAAWLQKHCRTVKVVLVAENDHDPRDPARGWPGLESALRQAHQLADKINLPVLVVRPEDGAKDARSWLQRLTRRTHKVGTQKGKTVKVRFSPARLMIELAAQVGMGGYDDFGQALGDQRNCWVIQPNTPSVKPCAAGLLALLPEHCGCGACSPRKQADYSDLENIDWQAAREEVGAEYQTGRLELADTPNPCSSPRFVGLQHAETWNPLEVKKRCGRCPGCIAHKVRINTAVIRLFLGLALSAGGRLYWREMDPSCWAAFRQRFSNTPAFEGKGYFCFRREGDFGEPDRLFVLTSVPGLGCPLNPGASPWEELADALEQIGPWLAESVLRGGRPYSSSREWEKDTLPKTESGFGFKTNLDDIDDDYRQRILDAVLAETRSFPASQSDKSTLSYRIYYKPGGWDSDSLDQFWSAREGLTLPGESFTVTLGKPPQHAQADADQPQDGWEGEWMPDPFAGL